MYNWLCTSEDVLGLKICQDLQMYNWLSDTRLAMPIFRCTSEDAWPYKLSVRDFGNESQSRALSQLYI